MSYSIYAHTLPDSLSQSVDQQLVALMVDWQTWLRQERGVSVHTLKAYTQDLIVFFDYLSAEQGQAVSLQDLRELRREDFDRYCAQLATRGTPASVARALSALKNFFRFLEANSLVCAVQIRQVKAPEVLPVLIQPLAEDIIAKVADHIAELSDSPWIAKRDTALFALLYGSGLQLGEALALNRHQAPRPGQQMIEVGIGKRQRTVPILFFVPVVIAEYLKACPHRLEADQALFVGVQGKRLNPGVVQRQLRRLRGVLALPEKTTPRTLRRSLALRLWATGGDLQAIQRLLGHAHRFTTQRYLDVGESTG
jgi:integrase/recombinase XerC